MMACKLHKSLQRVKWFGPYRNQISRKKILKFMPYENPPRKQVQAKVGEVLYTEHRLTGVCLMKKLPGKKKPWKLPRWQKTKLMGKPSTSTSLMKKAKKIITQEGEKFASHDDQPNINDMNDDGIQPATQ